mmetsp:Transcript_32008/g.48684  ORF Transcript_32008/g.48684 Transcript_32008/m.48684 type:complete len:426 (-) Transcript_32008:134-1411(-)
MKEGLLVSFLLLSASYCRALVVPTWSELETLLPSCTILEPSFYHHEGNDESDLNGKLVLYRDEDGYCPYSQQLWLALEAKNLDYITVLVPSGLAYNNNGEDLSMPKLKWPDGTIQSGANSIPAMLDKIQIEFPSTDTIDFYPSVSASVNVAKSSITRRFDGVMPRNTIPSSLTPYLLRIPSDDNKPRPKWDMFADEDGPYVPQRKVKVTLEEIEEILEEYNAGPFFLGNAISAADLFWLPFLERFVAQLPLIFPDVQQPREYELIDEWMAAIEEQLPCYACRIQGCETTWQRLLIASFPELKRNIKDQSSSLDWKNTDVWKRYASIRPHVADGGPAQEVAAHIVRNRDTILSRYSSSVKEEGLREACAVLANPRYDDTESVSKDAVQVLTFLRDEVLMVPRDIGVLPAKALQAVCSGLQTKKVAS